MVRQTVPSLADERKQDGRRGRYLPFVALAIAAIFLTAGVYMWKKQAEQKALAQTLDALNGAVSDPGPMEAVRADLGKNFGSARNYAKKILSVDPQKPSAREQVRALAQEALRDNKDAFAAWFVFEPDAFDGNDAQYREKDGFGETGRMAGIVSDTEAADWDPFVDGSEESGGGYRKFMESGKEGIFHVYTHVELDMPRFISTLYGGGISPYYSGSSGVLKETPSAVLGIPLEKNGRTIGAAGLDISLDPLNEVLYAIPLPYGIETYLVSDTGYVLATGENWLLGKRLDELYLSGMADFMRSNADPAADRWHFGEDGSALFCRRFALGDGEDRWTLAFLAPADTLYRDIRETATMTLVVGYVLLLAAAGIVLLVRRVKTMKLDAVQNEIPSAPTAPVDPVTAERLQSLNRQSAICRLLAVLFFLPSLFFMAGAEKQLKEATAAGNLHQAEEAVRKMWTAAIVGTCIGIPLLVLYIATYDY